MPFHLRVCFVVMLATTTLQASQQQPPIQTGATFRSGARLIVETVTVKDKNGNAIEGLTTDDFVLTEDGEPQTISFVEFQRLAATPFAEPPSETPMTPPPVAVAPPVEPTIATAPTDSRYRNRRLLVLYFDLTAMSLPDLLRAGDAAMSFIAKQMTTADLVAVMTLKSGAVRVKHDFTDKRETLIGIVQDLMLGDDKDGDGMPDLEAATPFGQNDDEFNIFNTDRQLSALQTAVTMLRPLAEQKSLIYFGGGLRLNGTDNQAQLRATINAAVRSGVVLNTIDTRGLVAMAPMGDATRPSPGGIGMFTGQFANTAVTNFQRSQDALYALAKDTGGNAFLDSNDLLPGIVRAADSMTSYYLLGYYSTHPASDGKFRRVKVSLRTGLAGELSYRQGYFADKAFGKFNAADKERQLEDALLLEDPITELTMAIEVNYFQLNRAEYFIPVAVKIPGSELALARRRGAARTVIDFIGEVKDEYGYTYQNLRDKLDIKLDDVSAAQMATRPVQIEIGFTLLPGVYSIKLLARDAETGRIGTYLASFQVPNLDRENRVVRTSSVVLSSQREPLTDAVFNARQTVRSDHVNPLVSEGAKLLPSVTRVFRRSQDLFVFLEAYASAGSTAAPLVAYVTFYRGEVKAFETAPLAVRTGADRTTIVPLRFSVPLEGFAPGRYECQVAVLDPAGQKVAFWRAPIRILP